MSRKLPYDPAAMMMLGFEMSRLMFEAQTVIALRLMGLGGFWGRAKDEDTRMVAEKQAAFAKAGIAMWSSVMRGGSAEKVASVGIKPLRRVTKSNVSRLGRLGPRLPRR